MQSKSGVVVVLGTGGTIAGVAVDAQDNVGYSAAQLGIGSLLAALPMLQGQALESEQVLQLDSKDMHFAAWQALAERAAHHLARPEVQGLVIAHGTDTMEETAYFLHRVLAPAKPVVLTGAMRPSTAVLADGPQNLLDAIVVARTPGACGVVLAMAGVLHPASGVRKAHSYRLDAFDSGDAGPLARIEEGALRVFREWPLAVSALGLEAIRREAGEWPRVEIVLNHAGADGRIVRALMAHGVQGIVVAGTGNGSIGAMLDKALEEARAAGVRVRIGTRCASGVVIGGEAGPLTPVQLRIELILELLGGESA